MASNPITTNPTAVRQKLLVEPFDYELEKEKDGTLVLYVLANQSAFYYGLEHFLSEEESVEYLREGRGYLGDLAKRIRLKPGEAVPDLREPVRLLAAGEVVAIPTETVYGLAADAANPEAVAKIFALKERPADHPLIVHVAGAQALDHWADAIPASARKLAEKFWPGPLTMILRKSARVPAIVTGGQDSVGIRAPSHPVAQAILREFAKVGSGALAAPSANKFGHVSPTTVEHVLQEFGPELPFVNGGPCAVGIESTIIDLSREHPVLLRPGAITREQLAEVLGEAPRERDANSPRASGTLAAHYAPRTPLALVAWRILNDEALKPGRTAVLARRAKPPAFAGPMWIVAPQDAPRYAHDLYANLRKLDASGAKRIVVEEPPGDAAWEAVNDRLGRAAAGAIEDDEP
jgi:L-threonylcarbamoyladenylate synthase